MNKKDLKSKLLSRKIGVLRNNVATIKTAGMAATYSGLIPYEFNRFFRVANAIETYIFTAGVIATLAEEGKVSEQNRVERNKRQEYGFAEVDLEVEDLDQEV